MLVIKVGAQSESRSEPDHRCPICDGTEFRPYRGRLNARCLGCGAKERERLMALALDRAAIDPHGHPVYHFAPELALAKRLKTRFGDLYHPADIDPDLYAALGLNVERVDLVQPLGYFAPESVGGFIHAHVLEHVPASMDRVLTEMNAALVPGGFHAFQVPIHVGWYREDMNLAMPAAERTARFFQEDHVRVFGDEDFDARIMPLFDGFHRIDLRQIIDHATVTRAAVQSSALRSPTGHSVYLFIKPGEIKRGPRRTERSTMILPGGERIDFVHPAKFHLPRYLKGRGIQNYEPLTLAAFLTACARKDGAVLDVGANIGVFALSAAETYRRQVHAYEPYPPAAEVLETIVRDYGFPVQVTRQAMSDKEGMLSFHISQKSDMSHSLNPNHRRHVGSLQVECTTIDRVAQRIRPGVIKIDAETSEADVLRGGRETLERDRPYVVFELLEGGSGAAISDIFAAAGYSVCQLGDPAVIERIGGMRGLETEGDLRNCLASPAPLDDGFFADIGAWLSRLEALPIAT